MPLLIVKFFIQFLANPHDELLSSSIQLQVPPICRVWIALAFVFHAVAVVIVRKYKEDWRGFLMRMHAMKKGLCPHRTARWMKCYRRANRRHCHKDNEEEEEGDEWQCPFETAFWRLQMPPPLPLHNRKHKRHRCKLSQEAATEEALTTTNDNKERPSTTQENPSGAMEGSTSALKKLMPTRASLPVVQTSLIDLARMQHWDALKARVNRREAKHHDSDGLYPLHW